jgi:hypothetical protein
MATTSSSDAWVLLAILYGGGEEGKDLRTIIAAADYVNHAIPGYEVLAGGLARLLTAGFVVEEQGRYRAAAGIVCRYNDLATSHRSLWPVWDELERFLQAHGPAVHGLAIPYALPRMAYEAAVQEYIRRF